MAVFLADSEIITKFLLNTCRQRREFDAETLSSLMDCVELATQLPSPDDDNYSRIPVITGSAAEFYIKPMLSCVGDHDLMYHHSDELAIPAGTAPPTQLPDEFDSRVEVYDIADSELPGYVFLVSSYLLTERVDDGKYNAVHCHNRLYRYGTDEYTRGPARTAKRSLGYKPSVGIGRVAGSSFSIDYVWCIRCLSWPPQAADWPTRHRNYGWPDSATVDRVVSNGCDVVRVAHRQCRLDEVMCHMQHRLSFSRAEIVLMNSWISMQQIAYHILRVLFKTKKLTDSAPNFTEDSAVRPTVDSTKATLNNYHIKTLMLWACEVKPRSWWIEELNIVKVILELLQTLGVWLTDARCQHYFIHNCNLFDHPDNWECSPLLIASRLMSETEASLAQWFINSYIRRCAQFCPDYVLRLFDDVSNRKELKEAFLLIDQFREFEALMILPGAFTGAQLWIVDHVSERSLTVRSCFYWMKHLAKYDHRLSLYFSAVTFLQFAYKAARSPVSYELLDVLATTCLQSNDARRRLNARHSSVLSLSLAAKLMKVVANNSRSTVQRIEIELSKAYLYRALRCKDSDSDSICCLANVYLAVLYYTTGQYQTAMDHCTLVTGSQGHSQCRSHVVQGELLPKIDDEIDSVLGLAVFYQYVRTAALNQQQQRQHVSVFTTELFAHYLHIRCLSITKCRQLTQTSLTDEVQRYQKCFYELQEVFTTDVLVVNFVSRTKYPTNDQRQMVVSGQTMPVTSHQLDTSELVELLQQSAVEHFTAFRQLEAQEFSSLDLGFVTTDFEALYAYKRGEYQRCLLLSTHNVRTLIGGGGISCVFTEPEFIQLMDDDIVSLIGLTRIVNPSCRKDPGCLLVDPLYLSMYLMTQCQMKLHHSVTSLAHTLDYVEVARRHLDEHDTLDQLLLKLTERKILLYISGQLG